MCPISARRPEDRQLPWSLHMDPEKRTPYAACMPYETQAAILQNALKKVRDHIQGL